MTTVDILTIENEVARAILKGAKTLTVNLGDAQHSFNNLPDPQKTGKVSQQIAYAKSAAKNLVSKLEN